MNFLFYQFTVLSSHADRAVLTCLGALGPLGWWGPYHSYGVRGGVRAVVICTSDFGNTHLGPSRVRHDVKLRFTIWGLTCVNMPKCMKTGGTRTLHENYKTSQLDHTAGEVEVQPLSLSLTLPLNSNPGTNVLCVLYRTCASAHFKCKQLKLQSMAHSKR